MVVPYLLLPQEAQFFRNVRRALPQLYQKARAGRLKPPVVLVFGQEEFLIQRVIQRLVEALLPKEEERTMAITVLEGKEATGEALSQALLGTTFGLQLLRRRVIIAKEPAFLKDRPHRSRQGRERAFAPSHLRRVPPDTFILIATSELLPPPLQSQWGKVAWLVPLPRLRPQDMPELVHLFADQMTVHIDPDAVQELLERVGPDARQLASEIEKLTMYVGTDGRVTLETVQALVPSVGMDVFTLMNAVGDGDSAKALQTLDALLQRREPPILILYLLARQFRFLLQARLLIDAKLIPTAFLYAKADAFQEKLRQIPEEIRRRFPDDPRYNLLQQSPSVVRNFLFQARHFTQDQIAKAFRLILETDVQFKTGIDQGQLLSLLVLRLSRIKASGARGSEGKG